MGSSSRYAFAYLLTLFLTLSLAQVATTNAAPSEVLYVARVSGYAYAIDMRSLELMHVELALKGAVYEYCRGKSLAILFDPNASSVKVLKSGNLTIVETRAVVEMPMIWRFGGVVALYEGNGSKRVVLKLRFSPALSYPATVKLICMNDSYAEAYPLSRLAKESFNVTYVSIARGFNPFYLANLSATYLGIPITFRSGTNGEICAYSSAYIGKPYAQAVARILTKLCVASVGGRFLLTEIEELCSYGAKALSSFLRLANSSSMNICSDCAIVEGLESFISIPTNLIGCYRDKYPAWLYYVPLPRAALPPEISASLKSYTIVLVVTSFEYVKAPRISLTIGHTLTTTHTSSRDEERKLLIAIIPLVGLIIMLSILLVVTHRYSSA